MRSPSNVTVTKLSRRRPCDWRKPSRRCWGLIVGLQLRANRLVAGRVIDRTGDGFAALIGPRRQGLKLGAIGVVALALAFIFAKGEHRVTAKSVLEAEVQRAAVAAVRRIHSCRPRSRR